MMTQLQFWPSLDFRRRPALPPTALLIWTMATWLSACSGTTPTPAATADASSTTDISGTDVNSATDGAIVNNWTQGYSIQLTFHSPVDKSVDGAVIKLDRDLTDKVATSFSFGSTHMLPPAIALAVQDHVSYSWKGNASPLDVQFNFGNLVESSANPAQCTKANSYPFKCSAPSMRVSFRSITYRSTCPALEGTVVITDWASVKDGYFAGHFSGTLGAFFSGSTDDCTDAAKSCTHPDQTVDIQGVFGFTLPAPDGQG